MVTANPENPLIVEALESALKELQIGDTLLYTRIDNLARGKRWLLDRARKHVQAETGVVFSTLRGIGIRRLPDEDIEGVGVSSRQSIVRKTTQVMNALTNALKRNSQGMDRNVKLKISTEASRQALIIEIAKG